MDQDALVGPQVAKVKQHQVGGDVVDWEGSCLLKTHPVWDEEGVAGWNHSHLLPQPKAVQHHHLVTNLKNKTVNDETDSLKIRKQMVLRKHLLSWLVIPVTHILVNG